MRRYVLLFAGLMCPVVLFSQGPNHKPFIGTWKLNVAKSTFSPGPVPKGETVTISENEMRVEDVGPDGKTSSWSFPAAGTTPVPIQGVEGATVAVTKADDHVTEYAWKLPDFTGTGQAVVSKDGKRVTYTSNGTNAEGKPVHNHAIYERQ